MTTKQKSILFLFLATVINLAMTIAYFAVFLLFTVYFLRSYLEVYGSNLLLLPLISSIIVSFFSYRALIKWADSKWNIHQHLGRR